MTKNKKDKIEIPPLIIMNKEQLAQVMKLLELDNVSLGKSLGFSCGPYQCKQVENLLSGHTPLIKTSVALAIECLARRDDKYNEFKEIIDK